ncbi:hypothetical protein BGZ96_009179 [Linnemannia gamsii]|uniref:F-box domain-containing protein n=1 Tax=Linnemannia gamsii TaxID=64522 RepID=A0ABQ7JX28_9FUNG|nr:hypothetical protein BGZ96_009179 [Linnemannia gamsii]
MSNSNNHHHSPHSQEQQDQAQSQPTEDMPSDIESIDETDDMDEEEMSEEDYYDPQDDLAQFHDQKLRIEESWLEWERQTSVNNRQSNGFHNLNIFQKPGSAKRRDRRGRTAHINAQSNRSGSASSPNAGSGSGSGSGSVGNPGNSAAIEKLRQLGTFRPDMANSIVHSYSTLSWEAIQAAREKRLAAKAELNNTGVNVICALPVELLSHIVSHLEPNELFVVSLVCQLFYHVVNADSCWKQAFIKFFGASVPFKRLDPKSWRGEYIKRTRLLRRWEKGRGFNVMIDPKIGQITDLWAETNNTSSQGWFLAGGLSQGVVAKCNPQLGKVQKDAVFRMMHLEVSVMTMDRHRVLWGLSTGQVSLTTLSYATAGQSFQTFSGFHNGPVSCVKLVPNYLGFVLTGGADGVVRLWDVVKARTVREFRTGLSLTGASTCRIDHICCEPNSRIIAGTSGGEIYIWDVDINAIVSPIYATTNGISSPARSTASDTTTQSTPPATPGLNVVDGEVMPEPDLAPILPKVINLPEEFKGVHYLEVDFGLGEHGLILAQVADSKVMHLYSLETQEHLTTLKSPAHLSPITAIHWDIPKYEKPMISLSNTSSPKNQQTLQALYGRHDAPSLLVTGDSSGNICLWYLSDIFKRKSSSTQGDLHHSQIQQETPTLNPTCVLRAHDTRVTSVFIDKLILVSGSADGWIKAWNPVNGKLVSVLNTGFIRGREANDTASLVNRCMAIDGVQCRGVISVGDLIRSWDFSPGAGLAKDKYRRGVTKKPINYSAGHRTKIQNDIRHSLEETVSLKRLESQVKERQQQLHKRYNNLQGLNMVDMTDEEVVEYVMMLSKEQDDQDTAIAASALEHIQDLEQQHMLEQRLLEEIENGGEGSSMSTSRSVSRSTANELVSDQELKEEEELVRRAIELSMLDIEPTDDHHDHHDHHHHHHHHHHHENDDSGASVGLEAFALDEAHSQCHQPLEWDPSQILDVDAEVRDTQVSQEDQVVVDAILKELQDEEDQVRAAIETEHSKSSASHIVGADDWPSIGMSLSTSESTGTSSPLFSSATAASASRSEPVVKSQEPAAKMTWSMVARTNSESSLGSIAIAAQGTGQGPSEQVPPAGRQPAIFRQYSQSAMQEEIEDEETQLARILSLSMVEK